MRKLGTHISSVSSAFANADAPSFEPRIWNDGNRDEQYKFFIKNFPNTIKAVVAQQGTWSLSILGQTLCSFSDLEIALSFRGIAKEISAIKAEQALISTTTNEVQTYINRIDFDLDKAYTELEKLREVSHSMHSTITSTNCYAYAANDKGPFPWGFAAQPGQVKNLSYKNLKPFDTNELVGLVEADGFTPVGNNLDNIKAGHYRVGMLLNTDKTEFHFIREDQDGTWSHKNGHGRASKKDFFQKEMKNPFDANWQKKGFEIIQFFHAPKGGVKVGIPVEDRPIIDVDI